jgi:hypothetical protein
MKKITLYTSIFLAALVLVLACKKEKPELNVSNHDPCGCAQEVSAEFVIEESGSFIFDDLPDWVETDTIMHSKTVRFRAIETDADEYTWYLGAEVLSTSSVVRDFPSQLANSDIPVTLVVRKTPNSICFPNDDGYDSIVRVMHVSQFPIIPSGSGDVQLGPIEGTYRFFAPQIGDSIDVSFNALKRPGGSSTIHVDVQNPFGDGVDCGSSPPTASRDLYIRTYRSLSFIFGANSNLAPLCDRISGLLISPLSGPATFRLTIPASETDPAIVYNYSGRKLN